MAFWDNLFKAMIEIHLANGKKFDWDIYNGTGKERFVFEPITGDHYKYSFTDQDGYTVSYVAAKVNDGYQITLYEIKLSDMYVLDHNCVHTHNHMRSCFKIAIEFMKNFWYH